MVQRDGRDDRHGRIRDVGGVPGAAHARLKDHHIDGCVGERRERHRGHYLEEREPRLTSLKVSAVDHVEIRRDVVVDADESLEVDRLAGDLDALTDRVQVGAGEQPGAEPK